MNAETHSSARGFKLLTIVGCAGTLVFLLLEAYRENFGGQWLHWQEAYARELPEDLREGFEVGIKQAFLPDLGRVDRCQSCHVGIDDPRMADAEKPLRTHPLGILASHPIEQFGCTICHQGQGREVSQRAAHGDVPHWEEPLLAGDLVYTSCGRCHTDNAPFGVERELFAGDDLEIEIHDADLAATIPGSELLRRGKQLFTTSGCLGCHQFRGLGGTLGPDLTTVGEKGVHGYDFSHLPAGVERTPLAWLVQHFMDPSLVSPTTVMPGFGASREEAKALAAYMLSLKSPDLPARFRPAPKARGGAPVGGEELYRLFCVACHGTDLAGSDVPAIRTPSLSNEGFLSVANAEFLTHIIANGRSGTEMPAWGAGAGGLSDRQIGRLVAYVLSFAPERADPAEISRHAGEPRFGRALFRGNCAACHGLEGEGGIGTRLNSHDFLALASDDFIVTTILEGRPQTGMPAWKSLRSQDVSDLLAYMRTWQRTEAVPAAVLDYIAAGKADAGIGRRLFRGRCADCHGKDGEGVIGPSLNNPAFLSIASDGYLAHAIVEGRPGTAMPAWTSLSVADSGDLIAYLRTLSDTVFAAPPRLVAQGDPDNGGILFQRACAPCHGQEAVGGVGPQLRNPVFLENASDGFLFQTIAFGRYGTPMRGFLKGGLPDGNGGSPWAAGIADFTTSQIADVVAWLRMQQHAGPAGVIPRAVLGNAHRGKDVYENTGSCAKCHGYLGEGNIGPAIGNPAFHEYANEGFLIGTMVLGREGTEMRNFGTSGLAHLTAEDLMDVAAYVRTLGEMPRSGRHGWRVYPTTADQVTVGGELFATYCAACHGPDGRGGYAPELNNPEFLEAASDGFLVATIARGRETTPMRPFGPGHASLADVTTEDLRAIVGFIRSWESPPAGSSPSSPTESPTEILEQ